MGRLSEIQPVVHRPSAGRSKLRESTAALLASPAQIWELLTPEQQHEAFQTVVVVCRSLANRVIVQVSDGERSYEQP
jgi:hypothetical protein